MGAKHTPGPWLVEKEFSNGCEVGPWIMTECAPNGTRRIVAKVGGAPYLEDDRGANTYANARLIAASPDLLEAARLSLAAWGEKKMVNEYEFRALNALRAAIAKAEGGAA